MYDDGYSINSLISLKEVLTKSTNSSYIPFKLGYKSGLRLGATFGLQWEDIDLENKVIYIDRQVQWYPDKERTVFNKVSKKGSTECENRYWYFSSPKLAMNYLTFCTERKIDRRKRSCA